jgi:hypothetical protein
MRRKLLAVAVTLGLLTALYAAAGYWLAPGYVREALAGLASEQGLTLEIAKVRTRPFTLGVVLESLALHDARGQILAEAESAVADLEWASLWGRGTYDGFARLAGGGEIASRGTLSLEPLAAEGTLNVAGLRAQQLLKEVRGELGGSARYVYADGKLELREVSLAGNGLAPAGAERPQGRIVAQGAVQLEPLELHLEVSAEALPLALAQAFMPRHMKLRVVSGAVTAKGRFDLANGAAAYKGSAALRDLRLEERTSGALLLAWQRAETDALRFASSPFAIAAGEVRVSAPEGRLVIERDGSVNVAALFAGGKPGGEPLRASVERLRVEKGTLHFADRSLETPFEVTISELAGVVTGITSAEGEPARVRLNGRVQPYGTARIRGTIDLDAPTSLADVRASFSNLRLEAFNPYIARFAGRRIESGSLSAELRYEVREGRLVGTNRLAFENMQLGEKLEEKGLVDLPLDLAVALLADSKGRIDLDIPVRGDLNDPQFDLGAIVARALGNTLKKIVSAPFRMLAGLFGGAGEDDPGSVAFAPGSAMLSPPAEESAARVAEGLRQRPQLGVEVHGGYDPARDLAALRLRAARQDVAREAGVRGPLDPASARAVRAAERLYLRRGGDRDALRALRGESEGRYVRALLQRLAASITLDEGAVQALARERAEAVRAALADHGADPARVTIAEPAAAPAGEEGVATVLSLTSVEGAAATGGTASRRRAP